MNGGQKLWSMYLCSGLKRKRNWFMEIILFYFSELREVSAVLNNIWKHILGQTVFCFYEFSCVPGSVNSGTAKVQPTDKFKSSSVNMWMVKRERCSWTMKKLCVC